MEEERIFTNEDRRSSSVSGKDTENKESLLDPPLLTPKVPKKFINNWKQACDRTKDRTKELLKKWRTLPEGIQVEENLGSAPTEIDSKWSEHIWNTWVKRSPSGEETSEKIKPVRMTDIQKKKFEYFFISYLDLDRDDVISLADFEAFTERIRHYSDWSKNTAEYLRLKEIQRGFVETFLLPQNLECDTHSYELLEKKIRKEQVSLQQWLDKWTEIINESPNFSELPIWLQYFPKILFKALNTSEPWSCINRVSLFIFLSNVNYDKYSGLQDKMKGTGIITKEEITKFFSSVLGLSSISLRTFADEAYEALTSNSQHDLTYSVYRLSFANFIFGRFPNGPGLYIFGPITGIENYFFPIDYSVFNSTPKDIEYYSPQIKSNRRSIIV